MVDFSGNSFKASRKFWAVAGKCYLHNSAGELVCYVQQKLFKLKEDITVYSDEGKTQPVLNIKARAIVDFSAAYDIVDMETGEKVGALKRKGLKSIIKDEWQIMDADDNVIAKLGETSGWGAFLSRAFNFVPQKYAITMEGSGRVVANINQKFAFFVHKFDVNFAENDEEAFLDRRLGIGAVVLLLIIEGRQN